MADRLSQAARSEREKWTAAEVKDTLRKRYPATQTMGSRTIPGPWTVIEEWRGIDVIAIGATGGAQRYAWIGHEVKVSRSDYRRELQKPWKRVPYKALCHELYFVVPAGLLAPEEIAGAPQMALIARTPLWVPEDVGLIEVTRRGCSVTKTAPRREIEELSRRQVNDLVRWVSARPDPRHEGLVEKARAVGREVSARIRGVAA